MLILYSFYYQSNRHRQTTAYVDTWTDPATNDIWYPVWLYKSWVSPPYSVQLYDDVQCK